MMTQDAMRDRYIVLHDGYDMEGFTTNSLAEATFFRVTMGYGVATYVWDGTRYAMEDMAPPKNDPRNF